MKKTLILGTGFAILFAIVLLILVLTTINGCALVKPALRSANDIARTLCEFVAGEASEAERDGLSPAAYCKIHEHLYPFIDVVLQQQKMGLGGLQADTATETGH